MAKKIRVKQIRSKIGTKPKQQATLRALGLRKINAERIHEDNPVIRGMVTCVKHLVTVEDIAEG